MHALFASGGPFVVAYASRTIKEKGAIRSTLSALWLGGNAALLAVLVARGVMGAGAWKSSALLLPVAAAGTAAGVFLHDRIPQKGFAALTQIVLAAAGAALLLT